MPGSSRRGGRRVDSYDNALAKAVSGLYKTEVIRHTGPWRGLDEVKRTMQEWVAVRQGGTSMEQEECGRHRRNTRGSSGGGHSLPSRRKRDSFRATRL